MHIILVADGRSPITKRWIAGLANLDYRITLVSTYPCQPITGVASQYVLPVAFGGSGGSQSSKSDKPSGIKSMLITRFRSLFLRLRYSLGPYTLPRYGRLLAGIIAEEKPDLVHAMRIPFEGMLGAFTPAEVPFAVSIWGNDLTFHSRGSRMMEKFTRRTLDRADGLLADANRDIRLGRLAGFAYDKSTLVVPGSGGVDFDLMEKAMLEESQSAAQVMRENVPIVINPRGFRPGSVRNDIFFNAIPIVLDRMPNVNFVCVAMEGQPEALKWMKELNLDQRVRLTPYLTQGQLWNLFKIASVTVSYSSHDGTPNSLLEAMSCGCFPVVGDIESLREWITPGVNGMVVDKESPSGLAEMILAALNNPAGREQAAVYNKQLMLERANTAIVRDQIDAFYRQLIFKG